VNPSANPFVHPLVNSSVGSLANPFGEPRGEESGAEKVESGKRGKSIVGAGKSLHGCALAFPIVFLCFLVLCVVFPFVFCWLYLQKPM